MGFPKTFEQFLDLEFDGDINQFLHFYKIRPLIKEVEKISEYKDLEKEYHRWINKYQRWKFPKVVYRCISLDAETIEDIGLVKLKKKFNSGLGVYWAVDKDRAIAYWGLNYYDDYIIKAVVNESAVDWKNTILSNLNWVHGEDEQEIRLKKGAYLFNVSIKKKEEGRWYSLKGFNLRASKWV